MNKKDLIMLTESLREDLKNLGIPISDNIEDVTINRRAKSRFGACKVKKKPLGGRTYLLEISEEILECETKLISSVIVHELLHTCNGCFNHGKKWKKYCKIVEEHLGLSLSRTNKYENFGLEPPAEKEQIKYIVKCTGCGAVFPRKRMCPLVKNPSKYKCGKCGNILYLDNKNHNIL